VKERVKERLKERVKEKVGVEKILWEKDFFLVGSEYE
jgi:hypothetical protein